MPPAMSIRGRLIGLEVIVALLELEVCLALVCLAPRTFEGAGLALSDESEGELPS